MTNEAVFRTLAAGVGFTEGPVWTLAGDLLVTSMSRGLLYQVSLADSGAPQAPVAEYETGGGPNGLAEGPGGLVYVAQNGAATAPSRSPRPAAPGLQVLDHGVVRDLVTTGLTAPNDIVVGPDGWVWFTDPDGATPRTVGGRVLRYDPVTEVVETVLLDVDFPNGLAFAPGGEVLYVADTTADQIVCYTVAEGVPGLKSVVAHLPGTGPDGIAFDADGNLYIAAFESDEVVVLAPDGAVLRRLSTGPRSRPTNLCFAGQDLDTLVVTLASGGRVVALAEPLPGARAVPWAG